MSDPYLIESKREEHVLQLLRLTNSLLARHKVFPTKSFTTLYT